MAVSKQKDRVRQMFDGIASRYDLFNHLLSANLDRGWRRAAARELGSDGQGRVLDLCGGTGDLSLAAARQESPKLVVCCDFSHGMLARAARKFRREAPGQSCVVLQADGLELPFASGTFDAVSVGFGVRNFADLDSGLREILRVLRPGGRLVILEFSQPRGPILGRLYRFYLKRVLPRIGDGVTQGGGPYRYLAQTIAEFPDEVRLAGQIRDCGFAACGWKQLSGGIVAIHTAFKGVGSTSGAVREELRELGAG